MIAFRSKRIEGTASKAGDRFRLIGDLTVRGTTREMALDVTYEGKIRDMEGKERAGFSATTQVDRRDFGLTRNQPLVAGGILVGNEVTLSLEVEAVQAGS